VTLTADPERGVATLQCDRCGSEYRVITGFIYLDGAAYAIHKSALHHHDGANEAWIDVVLDTRFDAETADRATFGCRVGPFGEGGTPACSLVPAAKPYSDSGLFGHKLERLEALAHPRLADFWAVVDFLLLDDPDLRAHVGDA
jgi:hypothetical protein